MQTNQTHRRVQAQTKPRTNESATQATECHNPFHNHIKTLQSLPRKEPQSHTANRQRNQNTHDQRRYASTAGRDETGKDTASDTQNPKPSHETVLGNQKERADSQTQAASARPTQPIWQSPLCIETPTRCDTTSKCPQLR